jgi:hypothetical protein
MRNLNIGDVVVSLDEEKLPLRSSYCWYQRAVVISNTPFVLISEDATMRWDDFPLDKLTVDVDLNGVEVFASDATLKLCSSRYCNDTDVTKHTQILEQRNKIVKLPYSIDRDERSVQEVFEFCRQFMDYNAVTDVWICKSFHVIQVDEQTVSSMRIQCNTLRIEKELPLLLQLPSIFFQHLRVFTIVYALN